MTRHDKQFMQLTDLLESDLHEKAWKMLQENQLPVQQALTRLQTGRDFVDTEIGKYLTTMYLEGYSLLALIGHSDYRSYLSERVDIPNITQMISNILDSLGTEDYRGLDNAFRSLMYAAVDNRWQDSTEVKDRVSGIMLSSHAARFREAYGEVMRLHKSVFDDTPLQADLARAETELALGESYEASAYAGQARHCMESGWDSVRTTLFFKALHYIHELSGNPSHNGLLESSGLVSRFAENTDEMAKRYLSGDLQEVFKLALPFYGLMRENVPYQDDIKGVVMHSIMLAAYETILDLAQGKR